MFFKSGGGGGGGKAKALLLVPPSARSLFEKYFDKRSVKNEALLKSNGLSAVQVPIRVVFLLKYERHRL